MGNSIIINECAIDYLTVTSRQARNVLQDIAREVMSVAGGTSMGSSKRMQFEGVQDESHFFGVTKEMIPLAMFQVSGFRAHAVYYRFCDEDRELFNCSRIDVQVTVELTNEVLNLFTELNNNRFQFKDATGKALKWAILQNDTHHDTLYIGSRKSDVYRRIYIKEFNGKKYLRVEVEYKGKRALAIFRSKITKNLLRTSLLKGMYFLVNSDMVNLFDQIKAMTENMVEGIIDTLPEKPVINLQWLEEIVFPYLLKAYHYEPDYIIGSLENLVNAMTCLPNDESNI